MIWIGEGALREALHTAREDGIVIDPDYGLLMLEVPPTKCSAHGDTQCGCDS